MAYNSDDFIKKSDMQSDSEVLDLLSKESTIFPNLKEKPLSPILSGGLTNRRLLMGKRLSQKKSRIKLTDRFKESGSLQQCIVDPIKVSIPMSFDESLSSSQTKTLVDHLDKLEELDSSRKHIYNILVRCNRKHDDGFKIPKPPAPSKIIKIKDDTIMDKNTISCVKSECAFQNHKLDKITPSVTKKMSVGFQTATGKDISVSENEINKCSKLFDDIIYPSQRSMQERQNKYNSLSKPSRTKENNFKTSTNENDKPSQHIKCLKSDNQVNKLEGIKKKDFLVIPESNLKLSEKLLEVKTLFSEDFNDINLSKYQDCGFKKASAQTFSSENNKNKSDTKDEFSFTQVISDSGISNTQISHTIDNILLSIEEDFRGFTKTEVEESREKLCILEKICSQSNLFKKSSKKRKTQFSVDAPMKKTKNYEVVDIEKNYLLNNVNNTPTTNNFGDFSKASGKSIRISEKCRSSAIAIFNDMDISFPPREKVDDVQNRPFIGFYRASGKSISVSENALTKVKNVFNNLNSEILSETSTKTNISKEDSVQKYAKDTCAAGKEKYFCNTFQNSSTSNNNFNQRNINRPATGFCKASGQTINVSEFSLQKATNIFDNLNVDEFQQDGYKTLVEQTCSTLISGKADHYDTYDNDFKNSVFKNISRSNKSPVLEKEVDVSTPVNLRKLTNSSLSSKRKLGMSHLKPIHISENRLSKAKLLFDKDLPGISPIQQRKNTPYTSTPIKKNDYLTPVKNDCHRSMSFGSFVDTPGVTPIKIYTEDKLDESIFAADLNVVCTSPTKSNWMDDLIVERRKLELRLQVLLEREKLGQNVMQSLGSGKADEDKMPREGVLYKTKYTKNKIPLKAFVDNKKPGDISAGIKLPIDCKNAENLHFKGLHCASIITKDRAVVIPNLKDMVGLSEICNAFEAMPGVESRLIPSGWIKNHYKWIVWKLASYENTFPNYLNGSLNIENIIQQLKYRYDREIDKAERSAVRRICEKDDAPQKRMILFVSNIRLLHAKKYELELCDGWYPICTMIDEPLCNKIIDGKIKIGTKLVISGSELMNCEGCHPLEATNQVHLKIYYNSTRRAVWHARLGFQLNPNPFPIQLQSIHPLGGVLAAIKVCVVRTYPLKFIEKLENRSVWRNKKAEEVAAQRWENERFKKLEKIHLEVEMKLESSYKNVMDEHFLNSDVSENLHEIITRDYDLERSQQNLSISQKESILEYKTNLSMKKQQDVAENVKAELRKQKLERRDVCAVLRLLVIDIVGDSERPFNFFIWQPTDSHIQTLREESSFTIQNVLPKANGDLNSVSKTTYKQVTSSISSSRFNKYKRRLLTLRELVISKKSPIFNEFDTVGIVVQTRIETHQQEVWITDCAGRLLFIKIYEGPDKCSLLDNLRRGQVTTVCNLVYRDVKKDIVLAVGNHFTVFSAYSKHKHLQEGLELFKKDSMKDVESLLKDCDSKIEIFTIISDMNSFPADFEDADEETLTS